MNNDNHKPALGSLYMAVVLYLRGQGVTNLSERAGVYRCETDVFNGEGPYQVAINGHTSECECIPPFHILIENKQYFIPMVALISPRDGIVVSGHSEVSLIRYFVALTPRHLRDDDIAREISSHAD